MYLRGRISINLADTGVQLRPPSNFFRGIANLLTKRRWETKEELETYKLLAFAQCTNRALLKMNVNNVARVAVGKEVVYEDFDDKPDDYPLAMQSLEARISEGFDPDPRSEFDMVLKHDDGVLNYVIDMDFFREHKMGVDPVAINVTAVPSQLRRLPNEDDDTYRQRIESNFQSQEMFDQQQAAWEAQLDSFLNQIADHFRTQVGIEDVRIEKRTFIPRRRDESSINQSATFGYPLYGYNPMYDLAYLMMWDSMWQQHHLRAQNVYYGDSGGYVFVGGNGWTYNDAQQYDSTHTASEFSSTDSAAAGAWWAGSDSGGGGWLSSIGDFSTSGGGGDVADAGGSSSGGGGDVGGGDSGGGSSCGGASSCGSGGGCGGGGGCGSGSD